MIDSLECTETPEGVDLNLRLAGMPVRATALIFDQLIRIGITIVIGIGAAFLGKIGGALMLVSTFLLEWFYPVFFEVYRNGQTPGKKRMNLRVLNDNGTPVALQASIIRNFLRLADLLPMFFITAMFSMVIDKKMRRVGDLAAGTVVVYCDNLTASSKTKTAHPKQTLPFSPRPQEQLAFMALLEREKLLSIPRKQELSSILYPIHKKKENDAIMTTLGYASALKGDK